MMESLWDSETIKAKYLSSSADQDGMTQIIFRSFRRHGWMTGALAIALLGAGWLAAQEVKRILSSGPAFAITAPQPGGVVFDGTNCFFAARYTNGALVLVNYPAGTAPFPPEWSLGHTGGVPRVATDGANLLMVWPDSAEGAWDIYGQFFTRSGSNVGGAFLIEADADAAEVGGLAFDGTNYLAVWEANSRNTNAVSSVQGRRIDRSGVLQGGLMQISTGGTAQKFPAVAWNGSEYLVTWTSLAANTNAWSVSSRRVSRAGALSAVETISEVPALNAHPPAVASDGTNWLAVWSREQGPYPVSTTNAMIPALRGRIVNGAGGFGGGESEVHRGKFGQFFPAAAFDGTNYVVAWVDRGLFPWGIEYRSILLREIAPSGVPVAAEITVEHFAGGGSMVVIGAARGWSVCAWGDGYGSHTYGSSYMPISDEAPQMTNFRRLTNGLSEFNLLSVTTFSTAIHTSTNLVHWERVEWSQLDPQIPWAPGKVTVQTPAASTEPRRFFRAVNGKNQCIENLRLIAQAKDQWSQDYGRVDNEPPAATELFGPGRYLTNAPSCPLGGTYYPLAGFSKPTCSLGTRGHTL
jgi:hypothetical protein